MLIYIISRKLQILKIPVSLGRFTGRQCSAETYCEQAGYTQYRPTAWFRKKRHIMSY